MTRLPARIAMSERDTDIEFEFFDDEPTTREAAAERPRRGGPRRPIRPPAGITPLLRLVGLISFAILLVVLLVFAVQSCRGSQKRDRYEGYMEDVGEVASQSQGIGGQLNRLLTDPAIKQTTLQQRLDGLAQQQQQGVDRARELEPPGPLRPLQPHVVEALELRVSGLRGLEDAFRRTAQIRNAGQAGGQIADQARRLLASDIVWDDLFKDPARAELERQDVRGVSVPDSNFVRNPDLITRNQMGQIWQRIRGASTGGRACTPRGTGLVSVRALPQGVDLAPGTLNTVEASDDLAFAVTVEDTGCSQEVSVPVTLTIQKTPSPIVKTGRIDLINPGEQKTVTLRRIGQVPFATATTIEVEVQPVKGETRTENNSAEYRVIFSLGT